MYGFNNLKSGNLISKPNLNLIFSKRTRDSYTLVSIKKK